VWPFVYGDTCVMHSSTGCVLTHAAKHGQKQAVFYLERRCGHCVLTPCAPTRVQTVALGRWWS
jgi:hypothetical protein